MLDTLKEKDDKFKHFISIFPNDFSEFPYYFTENELKLLKGTYLLEIMTSKKSDINHDYDLLKEKPT